MLERTFRGSSFSKQVAGVDLEDLVATGRELLAAQPRTRAELSRLLAELWTEVDPARSWARWGPWEETALEREGEPPPDGVGALRRFRSPRRLAGRPVVTREEVTVFEPPSVLGYKLLSGLPLRAYEARITLFDDGEQTAIHWRSEFNPKIPGTGGLPV